MEAKNEKIRQQFSDRLKREFARAGLPVSSPTQIANEFNRRYPLNKVAAQTMRKWLFAEAIPTQARLLALADWLEVSPQWLRFGMGLRKAEKSNETAAQSELIVLGKEQTALVPVIELLSLLSSSNVRLVENIVRCVLAEQGTKA
ncbi:hypothetical protein SAMN04515618_1308 [Collimonas sp. OK307]|uniref:hypothetical protein n=1 Tax=Collimonas sp. OK307 TaxID=1801620 RepID=UPI0008E90D41|nr:hypothetical protein [Collimonas sp. OK307]SFI48643.1 hypothetical protein SAMN04515618_1308 [Collimonas sp. OK307]